MGLAVIAYRCYYSYSRSELRKGGPKFNFVYQKYTYTNGGHRGIFNIIYGSLSARHQFPTVFSLKGFSMMFFGRLSNFRDMAKNTHSNLRLVLLRSADHPI